MRSFACQCGNLAFFENTQCLSCSKQLGWCPACHDMTTLLPEEAENRFRCAKMKCQALLVKCHNYAVESVCNRCCVVPDAPETPSEFCDYCRYNDTVPDLMVPGNREMWRRLEVAKRRLLYTVELEKARVLFQEAHRTVIGHFRHEIAHYYWQMLVENQREAEFKSVFGQHEDPGYADAQQRYYKLGPPADWQTRFVSAYASMHPWEDFAETFATYLDMVSVLDTAQQMEVARSCDPTEATLPHMVKTYIRLGVVLNEMNRAMGLIDLVPEILGAAIVTKLQYVHDLLRTARTQT